MAIKELSLFSGAGGGLLGTKLLGWECIGYVEFNKYCQKIIRRRIEDGIFDNAPIFGDIRKFINEGYADAYSGMVDVITAGFPCQPFSVAGKGKAEKDDRNMWPETIDVIRRIKPIFVFLENVPGLLSHEYTITIFNQLSENGYEALPAIKYGANNVGAFHRRKRIWILAVSKSVGIQGTEQFTGSNSSPGRFENLADPESERKRSGLFQSEQEKVRWGRSCYSSSENRKRKDWFPESGLGRMAYGMANRVERLKAIGNGQVPQVVRVVWELLTNEE